MYKREIFKSGIFDKGVLIPKDDKIPFASCSFTNLLFLFPPTEHKDLICNLPFLVLTIFTFLFSVFFFTAYAISLHVWFYNYYVQKKKQQRQTISYVKYGSTPVVYFY